MVLAELATRGGAVERETIRARSIELVTSAARLASRSTEGEETLASEEAGYVQGVVLNVDGGLAIFQGK
jgi:hypothetical protein